jgi:imidazolonepropionase-like amidohydrolase/ABC-type polysaccharide/polyol phosphate export permease
MMNAYIAQIRMNLRLTMRDRSVVFFNYMFPLIFLAIFGSVMHADQGGTGMQVITMSLSLGILGGGFFGAGMRSVMEREANILRRFKVAPITPGPILVSSMVVGLVTFLPLVVLVFAVAKLWWGMPLPPNMGSFAAFLVLGVLAFRAFGGIIGAVANSMQESQIIIQVLYFPMLFLSGATFPLGIMSPWLQKVAQFIPATYLVSGMQNILSAHQSILANDNLQAVGALALTAVLATFLGFKLFRWEKDEKMKPSAKLWVLAVMAPFFVIGIWQTKTDQNIANAKMAMRQMERGHGVLIRDARLFIGDGQVIDHGAVLMRNGKIEEVYEGSSPDPKSVRAEPIDAAGKTLLPGLIDTHVHLGSPGGVYEQPTDYAQPSDVTMPRELAAYLYSGVTAVRSAGDATADVLKIRKMIASGQKLGAELFLVGPLFTAQGGHGFEFGEYLPPQMRDTFNAEFLRVPKSTDEARKMVAELKTRGVDGIKVVLEGGTAAHPMPRLDVPILHSIVEAAHAANLKVICHTGNSKDVADALDAGVDGIEHGSNRDVIPDALFARMKQAATTYDPTLAIWEALADTADGKTDLLDRSLTQQVGPRKLLDATKKLLASPDSASMRAQFAVAHSGVEFGNQNLLAAYHAGVILIAGTDSGNFQVIHGPAVHRELQLWVKAGIPPQIALQAATGNAAMALGAGDRIGLLRKGFDASVLLLNGNPLKDIGATEQISLVMFRGERIDRPELFNQK